MQDEVDLFLDEVRAELNRARTKFPGDRIMTIALAEEFGELCKAVLDEPAANVRKEAVQTAVMAARVILDGDGSVNEWRKQKGLDRIGNTPTHYVHWNGGAWMVKEAEFFKSQGGLVQEWGRNWRPVQADSLDHARRVAAAIKETP